MGGLLGAIDLRLPFFAAGSLSLLNLLYGWFVLPASQGLIPLIVPWPMMALGIFGAFLQTFVFIMLTMVYISGATAAEEH